MSKMLIRADMEKKKLKPEDLYNLALDKKSIFVDGIRIRMPAAVMIHMQFNIVMRYIRYGCYVYKPKKNSTPWKTGPKFKLDTDAGK